MLSFFRSVLSSIFASAKYLLLLATLSPVMVFANSGGITGYHAWDSSDNSFDNSAAFTCQLGGCHDGTSRSATGLDWGSSPTSMAPSATRSFSIGVSGADAGTDRIGFNLAMRRTSSGAITGTFSNLGSGVSETSSQLTHSSPQVKTFDFTFDWTAPSVETTVRAYVCVNLVDNNTSADSYDGPPECGFRTISVVNNNPIAVNDATSTTESSTVQLNVKTHGTNDSDGDSFVSQTLTVTSVSQPTSAPNGTTSESGITDGLVTYNPNGQFEFLASGQSTTDVFTYILSDGFDTDTGTVTITINGQNDTPSVSVNGNPGYQEGDPAVTLDSVISVSDVDTIDQINRARVVITNYQAGEDVLACDGTLGVGKLTGITSCNFSAGTLTLLGTTSRANYAEALETVTYENTSQNPTIGDRTITFDVRDNSSPSNATSATDSVIVSVSSVSTPPSITGFSGTIAFTENNAVTVDTAIGITDPDSPVGNELNRATMTLTTNYVALEDSLVCPAPASLPVGISCSYSAPALTLSSATTNSLADYISAIQLVQYNNSSDDPDANDRTVSLTARDESNTVSTPAVTKTISITPVNDPPVITSTAGTSATENSNYTYNTTVVDPDDSNNGTDITYQLSGNPAWLTVSTTGLVSGSPPRTAIFNNSIGPVTLTVEDGDEDTSAPDTENFTLNVSPPDADGDGVPDYSDNCPTDANAGQQDLDNDTVHILPQADPSGIPANGDVDPSATDPVNGIGESYRNGGDACDEDTDGDGISNTIENSFAFLDPLNASDATLDYDGDGIDNVTEITDGIPGTVPDVDSVGPAITAPADITVDATGYYTVVDPGTATAVDGNDGNITAVVPVVNTTISDCNELGQQPVPVEPFRPGSHSIIWATCDSAGNLATSAAQTINVRPIASITAGQSIGEGQTAEVEIILNGEAPAYPVIVGYAVSGTATQPDDHDAVGGTIVINAGTRASKNVVITTDALNEGDEQITLTLTTVTNAVRAAERTHTITIVESNLAPEVAIEVQQNSVDVGDTIYADAGNVQLMADASDGNGDVLSYQWSDNDNSIIGIATGGITNTNTLSFNPLSLTAGIYTVTVTVSDASTSTAMLVNLAVVANAPVLAAVDTDGDTVNDNVEGAGDNDGDGIPNYLDTSDDESVLQGQTSDPQSSFLLQTEAGLTITTGTTAKASGVVGGQLNQNDIDEHGGAGGMAAANSDDTYTNIGGFYDFEIRGLNTAKSSAHIVIPLPIAILPDADYRKYKTTSANGAWESFVVDDNNKLKSAKGESGVCPAPGSHLYTDGLSAFDTCVQLTIEDGGPNDADGVRDNVIRDPGGVATAPKVVSPAASADGRLGVVHPLLLLVIPVVLLLYGYRKRPA